MLKNGLLFGSIVVMALTALARGILPCMVNRYGLTNEQIDDILTRHPDAQLRITAQDWRAMRYQLHRFGNMTNYVEQIGGSNDCARLLLLLDDRITELKAATNSLCRAARKYESALSSMERRYATATNAIAQVTAQLSEREAFWSAQYATATNATASAEARAARADALKTWLEEQRDKAALPTTKAIYKAILNKLEE